MSKTIKSFVMFDTESTGLPSPGNNPRITELCFIAVSREEIKSRQRDHRVFNKLHLCVNPCKQIHHRSSELTGLYNDALSLQATFSKQSDLIVSFLRNLPQPTCILAHNGHRFDFPLLQAELKRSQKALSENVYCADTLEAFREFDGLPPVPEYVLKRNLQHVTKAMGATKCSASSSDVSPAVVNESDKSEKINENFDNVRRTFEGNLNGRKRSCDLLMTNDEEVVKKETKLESLDQRQQKIFQTELTPNTRMSTPSFDCHKPHSNYDQVREDIRSQSAVHIDKVRKRLFNSPKLSLKSHDSEKPCAELVNNDTVSEGGCCSKDSPNCNVPCVDEDKLEDDSDSTQNYFDPESSKSKESAPILSQLPRHNSISDSDKDFLAACDEIDGLLPPVLPHGKCEPRSLNHTDFIRPNVKQLEDNGTTKHHHTALEAKKERDTSKSKNTTELHTTQQHSISLKAPCNNSTLPSVENSTTNSSMEKSQCVNSNKTTATTSLLQNVRKSYALGNLFMFYFGQKPAIAHTAEDDCKTLLKLISLNADKFISYCDENAVLFSDIDPMY